MDRLVSPGTGKGRGKGEKCHRFPLESGGSILSEWVHWAQGPRFGLHRAPGLPRLWEAGIPSPCSCLAGLRSKLPFEEVPGQLTTLCKSEDPGPDNLARDLTNQSQQASPSPLFLPTVPSLLPTLPQVLPRKESGFPRFSPGVLSCYEHSHLIR